MSAKDNTHTINVPRSDGRKHDLFSFAAVASNLKNVVNDHNANTKPVINVTEHPDANKHIDIKRSDGVTHDIIKVFKAQSDPRGETLKMRPTTFADGIRRSTYGKIDLQKILKSSGTLPLHPQTDSFHPSSVRIVHMSDSHNLLARTSDYNSTFLPHGDILIHSGNFTNKGEITEYAQFDEWLGSVKDTYHYRVVVAGNKDVLQIG